jgi:hypothetical protein
MSVVLLNVARALESHGVGLASDHGAEARWADWLNAL